MHEGGWAGTTGRVNTRVLRFRTLGGERARSTLAGDLLAGCGRTI